MLSHQALAMGVATIGTNVICSVLNIRSKANLCWLLFSFVVVIGYTLDQSELTFNVFFVAVLDSLLFYSSAIGANDIAASAISLTNNNAVATKVIKPSVINEQSPEEAQTFERSLTD
jgi:hypothetical protein